MAADAYQEALDLAKSLSRDEQLRLIQDLAILATPSGKPRHSILELEGLGAEIWQGIDPKQYVTEERQSWDR
jgi:hypothetical protein